ncbi:MAG: carbon-nitrogen hydrolase family protein, partial [Cyanobacteria bacterium P01_F01_bin.33]
MTNQTIRVAVVQTLAALGDVEFNISLLERYAAEAARQEADLVVFPECMNTGYLFDSVDHCRALAELLSGPFVTAMGALCQRYGLHIASGVTELDESTGKVYNSGVLLDDRGQIAVHYQKQFLATHDRNWFECGVKGCPVVDTALGRIGLLICFDGRIPEIARCLALDGAELIVDMANFFAMDQADMWVPARAYENGVWIAAATKSGVERSIYYPGGSMVVDPDGHVIRRIDDDTHGLITVEIDLERSRRKTWMGRGDRFSDRRPELYQELGKPFAETPLATYLNQPLVPEANTTKVAAVQAHATDQTHSWNETLDAIAHAAKLGIELLVLPELSPSPTWRLGESAAIELAARAEQYITDVGAIAKQYGCTIVVPLVRAEAGAIAPSAVLIGPDGCEMGCYRQTHLSPQMRTWAKAGDELPVFDTPCGRIGMLLGYDGLFPETARLLALKGADIVTWSCAWSEPQERRLLTATKAEDSRVYVVCVNRTDSPFSGGSFVIPPSGFPDWNVDRVAPPETRWGAVMPTYANL